jgi:hypothetical protein
LAGTVTLPALGSLPSEGIGGIGELVEKTTFSCSMADRTFAVSFVGKYFDGITIRALPFGHLTLRSSREPYAFPNL